MPREKFSAIPDVLNARVSFALSVITFSIYTQDRTFLAEFSPTDGSQIEFGQYNQNFEPSGEENLWDWGFKFAEMTPHRLAEAAAYIMASELTGNTIGLTLHDPMFTYQYEALVARLRSQLPDSVQLEPMALYRQDPFTLTLVRSDAKVVLEVPAKEGRLDISDDLPLLDGQSPQFSTRTALVDDRTLISWSLEGLPGDQATKLIAQLVSELPFLSDVEHVRLGRSDELEGLDGNDLLAAVQSQLGRVAPDIAVSHDTSFYFRQRSDDVRASILHDALFARRYRLLGLVDTREDSLGLLKGEGFIYSAFDEIDKRPVVLKIIDPEIEHIVIESYGHETQAAILGGEDLEEELWQAHQLKHPNINKVLKVGRDPKTGATYAALEPMHGTTLAQMLADNGGPFEWKRTQSIVGQVVDAITYAHSQDIYHQDLTIGNVMVEANDHSQVFDFTDDGSRGIEPNVEDWILEINHNGTSYGDEQNLNPEELDIFSIAQILFACCTSRNMGFSRDEGFISPRWPAGFMAQYPPSLEAYEALLANFFGDEQPTRIRENFPFAAFRICSKIIHLGKPYGYASVHEIAQELRQPNGLLAAGPSIRSVEAGRPGRDSLTMRTATRPSTTRTENY